MSQEEAWREIECPEWLDAQAVQQQASLWETAFQNDCHCLLHLAKVHFIDSTGLGLLIRLRKRAGLQNRQLVLVAPSQTVLDILRTMQLFPFFRTARNSAEAKALLTDSANTRPVLVQPSLLAAGPEVAWQGEVTAANADEVWRATADWISRYSPQACELTVNLSRLTFIDSTGVGLMLRVKKHALKEGVRLCFTAPQAAVRNVIKLSQVEACLLED
jgi:anti-anti-sigma factor